jgi:hypothetical protein
VLGQNISDVDVSLVTAKGFWVLVRSKEYFLSFDEYPWFRNARIAEMMNVELHNKNHLRWKDLDVELELDSLEHPERYPLCFDPDCSDKYDPV